MAHSTSRPSVGALALDELYVVSDLHLGGAPGRQLFGSAREFEALVEELTARPATRRVGLLINGDFIDFLSETPTETGVERAEFNPQDAAAILDAVLALDELAPIWSSLRRFLRAEGRVLIVNIGNHDLELALPWVREQLCAALAGEDAAARGRLRLALDGSGVLCQVADARVLCAHGNDVDHWNSVDHGALQRIGRGVQRGQTPEAWRPNGGSRMVCRIINPLKREFLYVDLLKPEGVALLNLLRAMGADLGDKVDDLAAALGMAARHDVQMRRGLLESPFAEAGGEPAPRLAEPAPPETDANLAWERAEKERLADELMDRAVQRLRRGVQPMDLLPAERAELKLDGVVSTVFATMRSFGYATASWMRGDEREEVLRNSLRVLVGDRSFSLTDEDDTYRALSKQVGRDIDILVAGHTHMERALPRPGGFYYNSGSWARLMRIGDEWLAGDEAARERFKDLFGRIHRAKTMQDIDATGITLMRCSVAAVVEDGGRALAELRRVALPARDGSVMRAVDGSQFPRGWRAAHA